MTEKKTVSDYNKKREPTFPQVLPKNKFYSYCGYLLLNLS